MEAIRKQATRLREQVAKQQQFDGMIHGDLHFLNSLLASYIRNKDAVAAWDLIYNIHSACSDLCSYTYTPLLGACSTLPNPIWGQQVHSLMIKMGTKLVGVTQTTLMDMYTKYGHMDDLVRVFKEIMMFKDVVTWNSLLSNFLQHDLPKKVLGVFEKMRMDGADIIEFTLCSLLKVCASLKAFHQGKQIHASVITMGRDLIVLNTALIDFNSGLGCIGEAMKIFHDLHYRGDDVICNSLVSGSIRNWKIKEAPSIMSSVKPNIICLPSAVAACADVADLQIGKQVHYVAIHLGFTTGTQLCNALLDMYAKRGNVLTALWIKAENVLNQGKFAAKHLIELEPDKTGNLVQLSDFYASMGAVLRQFGGGGYGGSENAVTDDTEFQQHQKLEKLYVSTRAGKHYQRNIVRGVEGFIVTGTKQVEIGNKLSEDSRKYGTESTCTSGSTLSRAALSYARAQAQAEKERENLLKTLGTQVAEPLRAMVTGTPLEDARHLAQRYDRIWQEAEAQAIEASKHQARVRETPGNADNLLRLEAAENKLQELRSNMVTLGKEAAAAMAAVEGQQQRLTLQRLIAMVEAECNYHQRVLQILDQLQGEMLSERQHIEAPSLTVVKTMPPPPSYDDTSDAFLSQTFDGSTDAMGYFFGEVMHSYRAESEVELNLLVGDYVVVRKVLILNYPVLASRLVYLVAWKVSKDGWAEGECKGKAGWFPFEYVERRDRVLASKVAEVF
ncbi:SH3 domain [Dillenia turbinata]|uniref:SH3 domain n=1 Tax=Dillenia turbinata TaxID=194707 RepID=A0AAN8ZLT0_9MAGN